MKLTLLEMVQNILSAMDSDEVNSISDTVESRQVAQVVKTAYYNIIARSNLPEHKAIFSLDASTDPDLPILMTIPENVVKIEWVKYNVIQAEDVDPDNPVDVPNFGYVTILPIQQFVDCVNQLNPSNDNVGTYTYNNLTLYFQNDRMPQFCTIIDNHTVLFDAYDAETEVTLESSKTMCWGQTTPTFTLSDFFIPDLDDLQFPLLLNEAKSLAFLELKQMSHPKAEQESKRQWATLQRTKNVNRPSDFDQLPNFGRTAGPQFRRSGTFR